MLWCFITADVGYGCRMWSKKGKVKLCLKSILEIKSSRSKPLGHASWFSRCSGGVSVRAWRELTWFLNLDFSCNNPIGLQNEDSYQYGTKLRIITWEDWMTRLGQGSWGVHVVIRANYLWHYNRAGEQTLQDQFLLRGEKLLEQWTQSEANMSCLRKQWASRT